MLLFVENLLAVLGVKVSGIDPELSFQALVDFFDCLANLLGLTLVRSQTLYSTLFQILWEVPSKSV